MIFQTNIEKILQDTLPVEIDAIDKEIHKLSTLLTTIKNRRTLLFNIAEVAGVDLSKHSKDSSERRDSDGQVSNRASLTSLTSLLSSKEVDTSAAAIR
jgi:hypothetical protein